jgi:predicted transposase YbfD/YdcC
MNAIQKALSSLKSVLQKSHEAFQEFWCQFTDLHAKLDANKLLDFAIHRKQNETQNRKCTLIKTVHVHSAVLHGL